MMRTESSWSVLPQAPNIIVPRQSFETWTPVRPSVRYSTATSCLGVVDDLRVRLRAELLGVWAAADTLVERVDRRDLLGREREVEDVEVLADAVRLDRLGDRAESVLDVPAQDDLCGGLAVLGREMGDDRIGQRTTRLVGAGHVDQDAAERRPCLGDDAELGVNRAQRALLEVRVQLDLVDRRYHVGAVDQPAQVLRAEVRDADRARPAVGEERLGGLVRADRVVEVGRDRLVEQIEVDAVEAEPSQTGLEADLSGVVAVVADPQLGGDEDLVAVDAGAADALPHLALVVIGGGGVDQPVADAQRGLDG